MQKPPSPASCPFGCSFKSCSGSTCVRRDPAFERDAVMLALEFFRASESACRWDLPPFLRWTVGRAFGLGFLDRVSEPKRRGNQILFRLTDAGRLLLCWDYVRRNGPEKCPGWEWSRRGSLEMMRQEIAFIEGAAEEYMLDTARA